MQPSVSVKHIKYEAESCVWIVCESVSLYQLNAATTDISSDLLTSGLAPPMMTFLFMKSLLFWKLTGCFNVVSVSDFLSCSICSVLNCIVLRQPAKIEVLCVCCGRSRSLELRCSRDAAQPQSVEAHTLTEVKPEADRTGLCHWKHCCRDKLMAITAQACIQLVRLLSPATIITQPHHQPGHG